ncbi:MAG: hypothetical protein ACP5MD_10300, partial [Verrucomicrobiia bacterium]
TQQCAWHHISMREVPQQTPQQNSPAADLNKEQFARHATIQWRNPNNEFGAPFVFSKSHTVVTALSTAKEADTEKLTKLAA